MKILFIVPLNESFDEITNAGKKDWKVPLNAQKTLKRISCCYPGGLLSIGSYVKKYMNDIEFKILDFNVVMNRLANTQARSFAEYKQHDFYMDALSCISDYQPDVIGISFLFCDNYKEMKPLTDFLRNGYPDSLIIAGGHLVTAIYEQVFSDSMSIDAISFAEGEIPVLELFTAINEGQTSRYLAKSPHWITKDKIKDVQFKPEKVFIHDLDDIPPYELDMLVFPDAYYNSSENLFTVAPKQAFNEMYIFSTRGCPNNCVFCASHNVHGKRIRSHSIDRVKNDILYYHQKYGITLFNFSDDHFFIKKSRALDLLNFVNNNNLMVDVMGAAFFSIDAEVAETMRKVGITQLNITIESGNNETLMKIIKKPADLKKAQAAIDYLHKAGITVIANVLIGFPGETKEAIDIGLEYLRSTNIDWFLCLIASPLPGSELYEICKMNNYLTEDYFSMSMRTNGKAVIQTPDFSPQYIERKVYEINLTLNFVNNHGMRSGDYNNALLLFERVLSKALDTHAFAYYFAAKCCEKLNLQDKYIFNRKKYNETIDTYPFWKEWSDYFHLEPLP